MTNIGEAKTPFSFEKLLFLFTRVFAIVASIVALVGVVVILFSLFVSSDKQSFVSLSDLIPNQQTEKNGNGQAITPSEIKIQIPIKVKQYLSGDNEKILFGWIKSLDKKDQEDFVDNLSLVIVEAEKNNEKVIDIINEYKTIKLAKLQKSEFSKYEKMASKGAAFGAMFGLVLFISLMSLILVMLAIERNTRKTVSGESHAFNNPMEGISSDSLAKVNIKHQGASANG